MSVSLLCAMSILRFKISIDESILNKSTPITREYRYIIYIVLSDEYRYHISN